MQVSSTINIKLVYHRETKSHKSHLYLVDISQLDNNLKMNCQIQNNRLRLETYLLSILSTSMSY